MLHTAIGESRNEHQLVLLERKWLIKVVRQILLALKGDLLDFSSFLLRPLVFRLPDIDGRQIVISCNLHERAGCKSKQIRADRLGGIEGCATLARLRRIDVPNLAVR